MSADSAPGHHATLAQAQAAALSQGLDHRDVQLMLQHVVQQSRSWVLTHDDKRLTGAQQLEFEQMCTRRLASEPMAYLLGDWEFYGHRLRTTPDVLIPRPDTETLVDWALEILRVQPGETNPHVLDMGTGSGAIAISLASACPKATVLATDISVAALAIAEENIARIAPKVATAHGSWWQAVPKGPMFDLIVSNPPYIAGDDHHLDALSYEPRSALTPGGDGLAAIREIVNAAPAHMRQGAWLLLEHGWDQAEQVRNLLAAAGLANPVTRHDIDGRERCTGAQLLKHPPTRQQT